MERVSPLSSSRWLPSALGKTPGGLQGPGLETCLVEQIGGHKTLAQGSLAGVQLQSHCMLSLTPQLPQCVAPATAHGNTRRRSQGTAGRESCADGRRGMSGGAQETLLSTHQYLSKAFTTNLAYFNLDSSTICSTQRIQHYTQGTRDVCLLLCTSELIEDDCSELESAILETGLHHTCHVMLHSQLK